MSATLLCWALVLGIQATAAYIARHETSLIESIPAETFPLEEGIYNRNRKILVEEVDKNGSSVVKELELPDYDEENLEEDKTRREQQGKRYQNPDMYGCDSGRESRRRKCLLRQKRLLRKRYRNWKEFIRMIMKDLDGKIKTLGRTGKRDTSQRNPNFLSGFSPRNVMRKKE